MPVGWLVVLSNVSERYEENIQTMNEMDPTEPAICIM